MFRILEYNSDDLLKTQKQIVTSAPWVKVVTALLIFIMLISNVDVNAEQQKKKKLILNANSTPILWLDPHKISARDLLHGPGGEAGGPQCPCKFLKEDRSGTSPKFLIKDKQGVEWKVKIGEEARSETAAVRLLSAIGYFADETYFFPMIKVEGLKLNRGKELVGKDLVYNARIERTPKQKVDNWRWFHNPFLGTKEWNGLRVMMALLNNWDIKSKNNRIDYYPENGQLRYLVNDLGASFGRTGGLGRRTTANPSQYAKSRFIKHYNQNQVDFVMSNYPTPLLWVIYPFAYPFLKDLLKRKNIVEHIPIDDVRWVTELLMRLSDQQIADVFRGAGFNSQEVLYYALAVRKRIDLLVEITHAKPILDLEKTPAQH